MMRPRSTDVFVIGGRPAGLAAAIAARRRGFDVTLADGAVAPDGIPAARSLGVDVRDSGASVQAGFHQVSRCAT